MKVAEMYNFISLFILVHFYDNKAFQNKATGLNFFNLMTVLSHLFVLHIFFVLLKI
jgi:hypothetical protein